MVMYVEEFLWRGRPEGSEQPSAYHLVLGDVSEDAFGRQQIVLSDPMTPLQAEALGFPLSSIVATINADALIARDQAAAEAAEAAVAKSSAEDARSAAEAELALAQARIAELEKKDS